MILAWRLIHKTHVASAFSGDGAKRYGGRWNSIGVKVVYASDSLALATMELMAHSIPYRSMKNFVFFKIEISDNLILTFDAKKLPKNWFQNPPPPSLQKIGDSWVKNGTSAVLKIPSVIVPAGFNVLINPDHPDFGRIIYSAPKQYVLEERLKGIIH
jgi:RES domain-containing protein